LLFVSRLSALPIRGDDYWDPPYPLPFLKSIEKGATTLVLFAYAIYVMLYLLLPSGGLYYVMYLAGRLANARLTADADPKSASEYGRELRHG
jgi:hypothetical protein